MPQGGAHVGGSGQPLRFRGFQGGTSGADASASVTGKAWVKVNGAELTDRDCCAKCSRSSLTETANGGFPKKEEKVDPAGRAPDDHLEELVYQEAVRRKMTIAPARITREEHNFKGQLRARQNSMRT